MLASNKEYIMINHIQNRRSRHISQLIKQEAPPDMIRCWEKFYQGLLFKYNHNEVNSYFS